MNVGSPVEGRGKGVDQLG